MGTIGEILEKNGVRCNVNKIPDIYKEIIGRATYEMLLRHREEIKEITERKKREREEKEC